MRPGYGGRIAFIDLSKGYVKIEATPSWLIDYFFGGKGFAYALVSLYARFSSKDPLYDPSNVVVIAPGMLSGLAPGGSKVVFATRSPLTGMICDTYVGQVLAAKLKYAGFDALVIKGVSTEPVYLLVEPGHVSIQPANHLWGCYTSDTTKALRSRHGARASVACIGPAGEKLVRYANVIVDEFRAAGRCGVGAILGFKRVKAIVVIPGSRPSVYDERGWREVYKRVYLRIRDSLQARAFRRYGTCNGIVSCASASMCPCRHWKVPSPPKELVERLSGDEVLKREVEPETYAKYAGVLWGWGCPIKCSKLVRVSKPGFEHVIVKPEYENLAMLGCILYIFDLDEVLVLEWIVNNLGLDSISLGETIAWLFEILDEGVIEATCLGLRDTDKFFGNAELVKKLVELIARRLGVGAALAEGVERVCRLLGRGCDRAVHVKGLEAPAWDPRGRRALGLSYATADIGASHLRGWPHPPSKPSDGPAAELVESLIDDRDWKALLDTLGLCTFIPYEQDDIDKLLRVTTGFNLGNVKMIGARVEAIARIYGALAGRVPDDDRIPDRWMEPFESGPLKGMRAFTDLEDFERALRKFYRLRGYDVETGLPTWDTLEKLGLTKFDWIVEAWVTAWREVGKRG